MVLIKHTAVCNTKVDLVDYFYVFLTVHHSIDLFHLPTIMHNSLFMNNIYVTL
jgi:hypothetical protein